MLEFAGWQTGRKRKPVRAIPDASKSMIYLRVKLAQIDFFLREFIHDES
jgi:hypothetical protein